MIRDLKKTMQNNLSTPDERKGTISSDLRFTWMLFFSFCVKIVKRYQGQNRVIGPRIDQALVGSWALVWQGISGGQSVETRSTSGVTLKSLGYNGSNELLGRSVASKLWVHEPDTFFFAAGHRNQ